MSKFMCSIYFVPQKTKKSNHKLLQFRMHRLTWVITNTRKHEAANKQVEKASTFVRTALNSHTCAQNRQYKLFNRRRWEKKLSHAIENYDCCDFVWKQKPKKSSNSKTYLSCEYLVYNCIMAMKWWKEKRSRRNRKHLFDGAEKKIEIFSSVECKRETYIATRKTVNAKLLLILAFDNLINRIMQFSLSKKQNEIRKRML